MHLKKRCGKSSTRRQTLAFARELALREIDQLPAFAALVGSIEFVGKNFFRGAAFRAVAGEGFQTLEIGVTGAMLGRGFIGGHDVLSFNSLI
jgi:hypothetical protein